MCKLYKVLKQKSSLTLPPDPGSVTQAIKRVNLQMKIWFQSFNQNMTEFEQNGWKRCDDKLIMVPVWFTGSQLPPTDMKRSHKVKVTKKDVHLSDDNLDDDQENITEPKKKEKAKLLTVRPSSESNNSSITKLNWINTFGKNGLIDKFYEGDYENSNSSDKEGDREVSDFLSSEDYCDEWLP